MKTARIGDTVKVHYTGKFKDGKVFETSEDREPKQFTIGKSEIIPGLEKAVVGMKTGESKTVALPAEEAFGPYRKELVQVLDRNIMPTDMEPKEGETVQALQENGRKVEVTIKEVSPSTVTLDANHPLAGKDLIFNIRLVAVA
jgi:peptidylprolyl isomerase